MLKQVQQFLCQLQLLLFPLLLLQNSFPKEYRKRKPLFDELCVKLLQYQLTNHIIKDQTLVDSLCITCIECIKIVTFFVRGKSNFFFSYIRFFCTFPFSISLPIIILLRPTFLRCMTRLPTVPTLVGLYLAASGCPMSWALTMIAIRANT